MCLTCKSRCHFLTGLAQKSTKPYWSGGKHDSLAVCKAGLQRTPSLHQTCGPVNQIISRIITISAVVCTDAELPSREPMHMQGHRCQFCSNKQQLLSPT